MDLNQISKSTIDRYSKRYNDFGKDIKTLGWGSTEQQEYRFARTLGGADFSGRSVLDIGCGFGDYENFLRSKTGTDITTYSGCDINPDLIREANKQQKPNTDFFVFDLTKDDTAVYKNRYDIGVMLGLLNFNLGSAETNLAYSKLMITNALALVKEVLIVDFLSARLTVTYPKEDFVFYHEPSAMLDFALRLSENVVLRHDYTPIPQKEFLLFIYK